MRWEGRSGELVGRMGFLGYGFGEMRIVLEEMGCFY